MQPGIPSENQFVMDLLMTLREEKFSLPGWWRFLARAWDMSYRTANDSPTLLRSWRNITVGIGLLVVVILLVCFAFEGSSTTLRILPGFLFCAIWQQSDLYWHLGLNRQVRTGALLPTVGIASTLTWLRALGASFLLGRLLGGISTSSWLALLVFLCGIATDILDGQIARRTGTQSKLGQIGDGEADFCLYLALTIILIQNAVLPLWLGLLLLLRFLIPLLAALGSYFLLAQPVRFGSTIPGKFAGLAQCLYFLVLLAPTQLTFIARFTNLPLLFVTLILLVVAPVAQFVKNARA
jgi:phosphatidylglycerophosphate synthase